MKIETILATKGTLVITIRPEQTLKEAIALLAQRNIGALPVVDAAGNLAGIVSERDVIRRVAQDVAVLDGPVSAVMTRNVVVGSPQDELTSVLLTMTERRFRHLPVIDGDRLVGIVSLGDLVKAQVDHYQGQLDTLETQILDG